ncbi:thiamine phosphate synthase [Methanobrevibacter millerae]|uniref:Thiamine-phosphate synthase n=1 Tax=Methanobrevibacter millerae TaxID=230361 RepID=A0A1G5VG55_9EURY|nr:thiamine phosphate synthase [Methanobrevibacter millerae]SDA44035.1 thiamine-phosphate pyrophosphorylase [Methanobrevibacter millerae]
MNKVDLSLYLVTDNSDNEEKFLKTIEDAILGGVSVVQIREKTADTLDFYNLALKVKKITGKYNVPLIINDRVDIALAIDADGVHVGQSDMPCDVTRKLIGKDKILGVSAATVEEAQKAEKDGADYIGTGAIFPTATKDDAESVTINELKEIVESINIPVVAIGGITLKNASELVDTGIAGLSVVSAIMSADNPKKASEELLNIFNS